jgi:integrase
MGAQKGWLVNPKDDAFQGRAWDPKRHTYKSKTFRGPGAALQAEEWAKMEHARLTTGLSMSGRAPLEELLDSYEKDLIRRGLGETYRLETMRMLRLAFVSGVRDLLHPNVKDHARDWLAGLRTVHKHRAGRALSPQSQNVHLKALKTFANWCMVEEVIRYNPFLGIKAVKVPDHLKPTFSVTECGKLTDPAKLVADSYGIVVALQLYAGLRTGEALNMRWEWIDFRSMNLSVRQWKDIPGNSHPTWRLKGDKERDIPLEPGLAALLQPFAQLQGWVTLASVRSAQAQTQRWRLDRWCTDCGVTLGDRTPHSTRHTWIALKLACGENQLAVRDMAGHSSLDTTAGYARNQMAYRDAVRDWPRGVLRFREEKKVETGLAKAIE